MEQPLTGAGRRAGDRSQFWPCSPNRWLVLSVLFTFLDLHFCRCVVKVLDCICLPIKCDTCEKAGFETPAYSLLRDVLCTWTSTYKEILYIWLNQEFSHLIWPENTLNFLLSLPPSLLPFLFLFISFHIWFVNILRICALWNSLGQMQDQTNPFYVCFSSTCGILTYSKCYRNCNILF